MSKDIPLVSIIIPVYNCEKYLNRCIDSIRAQTYEKYEVLLIDDGSSDNSAKICDKVSDIDKRFRCKHTLNGGAAKARNIALDEVQGAYITFIDADDYVEPEYLEKLQEAAVTYNADISQCLWRRPNTIYKETDTVPAPFETRLFNRHEAMLDFVTENRLCNSVWGKLFKREIFNQLRFPRMRTGEDSMLLIEIYKTVNRVVSIPYIGYIYFMNEQGLDSSRKNDLNSVKVGKAVVEYAEKFDMILLPPVVAKYSIFLLDAFCEAVRNNRFDITKQLSDNFASIALKRIKGLNLKMQIIVVMFHLNKRFAEKILIKKFQ